MSSSETTLDLRSTVRFPLKLAMAVKTDSSEHKVKTRDISAGGVLFEVEAEMPAGAPIEFSIAMPAAVVGTPNDVLINCTGRIVRCSTESGRRTVAAVIDEYCFERS